MRITDSLGNEANKTVTVTGGVAMAPAPASVRRMGTVAFEATGGSGAGYVWSLATNASGGSVNSSTGSYTAGPTGGTINAVRVVDSLGNEALGSVTVRAAMSLTPTMASVPPKGSRIFSALGGSGTGYAWSLATNASGGSVNTSTGSYTAGPIGGVTDVVCVTDSLGEAVCAEVAVGVGVSISPASSKVQTGGTQVFEASGGSGAGYVWSLATNASGGSIRFDRGAYTAGSTGDVMDVAKVTDSLGNVATANVTVTTPPSGGGCNHGAVDGPGLIGLALAFLLRPRSRRSGDDGKPGLEYSNQVRNGAPSLLHSLALGIVLVIAGGCEPQPPAPAIDVTGTWVGTVDSTDGPPGFNPVFGSYTLSLDLVQAGSSVTGTFRSVGAFDGTIVGTVTDDGPSSP